MKTELLLILFFCAAVLQASLTVQVFDDASVPLEGCSVRLGVWNQTSEKMVYEGLTDSSGICFFEIPDGIYSVEVERFGYNRCAEPAAVFENEVLKKIYLLKELSPESENNSFFSCELRGRIFSVSGKPLPGVRVSASGRVVYSTDDGRYCITDLFSGDSSVSAEKDGFEGLSYTVNLRRGRNFRDFRIKELAKPMIITGKISSDTGKPVRASVRLGSFSAESDQNGFYRLVHEQLFSVSQLSVTADGFLPWTGEIRYQPGEMKYDLLLTSHGSGCTITGFAAFRDSGNPVIGAKIIVADRACYTGPDGKYHLTEVPYGKHEIIVLYRQNLVYSNSVDIRNPDLVFDILAEITEQISE